MPQIYRQSRIFTLSVVHVTLHLLLCCFFDHRRRATSAREERLKTLASKRTALVLGDPAAAAAGLKAAGFQRVAAVAGAPASTAAVEGVEMVEDLVQALQNVWTGLLLAEPDMVQTFPA